MCHIFTSHTPTSKLCVGMALSIIRSQQSNQPIYYSEKLVWFHFFCGKSNVGREVGGAGRGG